MAPKLPIGETVGMALNTLRANRLRSLLTMLGIIIGNASVISLVGVGRGFGETMAVLMVTGNAAKLTLNPFDSVRTMTATIAAEMGEVAFGSHHYQALFWVGIFLLIMTFGLNVVAQKVLRKYQMR